MKTEIYVAAALLLAAATTANADNAQAHFEVSITNLTKGIRLTPFIASTHGHGL